jgi:ketosteroid isomerase-like protein
MLTRTPKVAAILFAGILLGNGLLTNGNLYALPQHSGYAAAEQAVAKLETEWFADQMALNWPKLKNMVSEDFVLTESDGRYGNRETMFAGYQTEAPSISDLKMTFLVTHAVVANAVIATGLETITLKDKDGRISHRYERFTDTWVLRDGRWQCVAEQLTLGQP